MLTKAGLPRHLDRWMPSLHRRVQEDGDIAESGDPHTTGGRARRWIPDVM